MKQHITQKNFATEESLFVPCTEDIYKFVSPRIRICTCPHATAEELEIHYLYQQVTLWVLQLATQCPPPAGGGEGGGDTIGAALQISDDNF